MALWGGHNRAPINYPLYFRNFNHSQKLHRHPKSKQYELQTRSEDSPTITSWQGTSTQLPGKNRWVLSRQGTEGRVVYIRIYHMRTGSCKQVQSLGQMKKHKLYLPFQWILLDCPHCSRIASPECLHCTYCGRVACQICGSYAASDITNSLPVIYISECLKQQKVAWMCSSMLFWLQGYVVRARVAWVWVKRLRW